MTIVRTLGKNTLGDNNKMKVAMRDYDMSTHDISTIFRSSIGVGMLVVNIILVTKNFVCKHIVNFLLDFTTLDSNKYKIISCERWIEYKEL